MPASSSSPAQPACGAWGPGSQHPKRLCVSGVAPPSCFQLSPSPGAMACAEPAAKELAGSRLSACWYMRPRLAADTSVLTVLLFLSLGTSRAPRQLVSPARCAPETRPCVISGLCFTSCTTEPGPGLPRLSNAGMLACFTAPASASSGIHPITRGRAPRAYSTAVSPL